MDMAKMHRDDKECAPVQSASMEVNAEPELVWEACALVPCDFAYTTHGRQIYERTMCMLQSHGICAMLEKNWENVTMSTDFVYSREQFFTGNWPHYRVVDTDRDGARTHHTFWRRAKLDAHGNVLPVRLGYKEEVLEGPVWKDTYMRLRHFIVTVRVHKQRAVE